MKPACDNLKLDLGDALDGVKAELKQELREELGMENMHRMTGLGQMRLLPTKDSFRAVQFGAGIITIPASVSFIVKLAAMPGMVTADGINPALSRFIFLLLSAGASFVSKANSFAVGAMVGQVPGFLDVLTDWAVSKIAAGKSMKGLGATEEEELRKLREELQKMSGLGAENLHKEWDMQGLREDDARINLSAVDSAEGSAEVMEPMTRRSMSGREMMVVR